MRRVSLLAPEAPDGLHRSARVLWHGAEFRPDQMKKAKPLLRLFRFDQLCEEGSSAITSEQLRPTTIDCPDQLDWRSSQPWQLPETLQSSLDR